MTRKYLRGGNAALRASWIKQDLQETIEKLRSSEISKGL